MVLFIRGPLMRLADIVGAPLAQLVRAAIAFVTAATQKLQALEAHVSLEAAGVRATVEREAAATREHVAAQVLGLRERVSDAERAVTATGQHAALPPSSSPATSPDGAAARRSPQPTLPSIVPPAAAVPAG
jgi:hypothetical protein